MCSQRNCRRALAEERFDGAISLNGLVVDAENDIFEMGVSQTILLDEIFDMLAVFIVEVGDVVGSDLVLGLSLVVDDDG
jgi:hypothetical protein